MTTATAAVETYGDRLCAAEERLDRALAAGGTEELDTALISCFEAALAVAFYGEGVALP